MAQAAETQIRSANLSKLKNKIHFYLAVVFLSALGMLPFLPTFAGDEILYQTAVSDYNAKNYERALKGFDAYIKSGTDKPDAFYYEALILQQIGRLESARKAYNFIIKNFPGTNASALAKKGLATVEVALTPGPAFLPKETWVPFVRRGKSMVVEGKINGQRMPMIFDTGAERCAFSLAQLRQLGIPMPSGPPSGSSMGVGKSEPTPVWTIKVDLVVGHIERHGFAIMAGDMALPAPLLGQDFFTGMEYSIDTSSNAISFKKHETGTPTLIAATQAPNSSGLTVDASGKYVYTVPFTLMGECALVKVLVNGHELPMIFDTGAEICLLSAAQAKEAGVSASSSMMKVTGIGGAASAAYGVVSSIKLGPIEKGPMRIPITDKMGIQQSLLGQDFFRGWHYTIDKSASVIRFTRATGNANY